MTPFKTRLEAAEIAVVAPIDKTLTYAVPDRLADRVQVGSRVHVPLGRRQLVGYVIKGAQVDGQPLKEIIETLDDEPFFNEQQANFYLRAADYYAYPPGEAVRTALPAGLSSTDRKRAFLKDKVYRLSKTQDPPKGPRQKEILTFIKNNGESRLSVLRSTFPSPYPVLRQLVANEYLEEEEIERTHNPFEAIPIPPDHKVTLNSAQEVAVGQVKTALAAGTFRPFLLHGVTGSGKTEVYLRSIENCLNRGRRALLLVPEISLTPQLVARFRSRFHEQKVKFSVLHSALSERERYESWRLIARGAIDVVIGARSAVFAPIDQLGLIVVDEEHDGSYKQSEGFRYNARDLALMRAQKNDAVVLLGSATPALTTYHRATSGQIAYLELPDRTGQRTMPDIQLVDLCGQTDSSYLSQQLKESLAETLLAGEQSLLLLNRRGYAPFLLCHDCGASVRCPNCGITLTYSRVQHILRCHYCDFRTDPSDSCPKCKGINIFPEGIGTERLEEEILQNFPNARVARMDRDTTSRKGSHQSLVDRMLSREIDILIGTQMIAKGHDFPAVTLVGVLNADAALNLPDFRSSERVFSLLSQVAGRAGRGQKSGKVLIQTFASDNYALEHVALHDYTGFAQTELSQRQLLAYPPFGFLVNLVLSGLDLDKVHAAAKQIVVSLEQSQCDIEVLGPAPCLLARLRNRHRVQILIKASERKPLRSSLDFLRKAQRKVPNGVQLTVDVDPIDMF